jgi:hypothetical protein
MSFHSAIAFNTGSVTATTYTPAPSEPQRVFCRLLLSHLREDHLLPYCCLGHSYAVCAAAGNQRVSLQECCRKWLLDHTCFVPLVYEPAFLCTTAEDLLWEYRAMIGYLGFVCRAPRAVANAFVVGGSALAYALREMEQPSFQPGDADIFVWSDDDAHTLIDLYQNEVVVPLGLKMIRKRNVFSWRDGNLVNADEELVVAEDDDTDTLWTPEDLRHAVQTWLVDYFEWVVYHPSLDVDARRSMLMALEAMQPICDYLPDMVRQQEYRVEVSYHCQPFVTSSRPKPRLSGPCFKPHTLPQLNVIVLSRPADVPASVDTTQFVCSNFDISACSCVLRVRPDLSFIVEGFCGALVAAQDRRLVLRNVAFSCSYTDVEYQMARIIKYVRRGFSFGAVIGDDLSRAYVRFVQPLSDETWDSFLSKDDYVACKYSMDGAARGPCTDMDDATHSYGGSSTQNAYDMMHKDRATFAQGEIPYGGYDYWNRCQLGDERGSDPVVAQLALSSQRH